MASADIAGGRCVGLLAARRPTPGGTTVNQSVDGRDGEVLLHSLDPQASPVPAVMVFVRGLGFSRALPSAALSDRCELQRCLRAARFKPASRDADLRASQRLLESAGCRARPKPNPALRSIGDGAAARRAGEGLDAGPGMAVQGRGVGECDRA